MFPFLKKKDHTEPIPESKDSIKLPPRFPLDLLFVILELLLKIDSRQLNFKSKESLIDLVLYQLPDSLTKSLDQDKLRSVIELEAKLFIELKSLYTPKEPIKKGDRRPKFRAS